MRASGPLSWLRHGRPALTESQRRRRRRSRTATVLLLSSTLTVTSLGGEALAVPDPGMSREKSIAKVDLPDLPEATEVEGDEAADKTLTLAPENPVDPYAPGAVAPWTSGTGSATLSTGDAPGTTKPVSNNLPVAIGVPAGGDPAGLAGDWTVGVAPQTTSQDAGVSGIVMKVTPPATVDPAAEVAISIDTTGFADLYGPQAADRFGLMLLPECVYSAPTEGDCADGGGVTTMSVSQGDKDVRNGKQNFQRLRSTVRTVAAKDAPTRSTAARNAGTRKILGGSIPVSSLVGEGFVPAKAARASQASFRDGVQPAVAANGGAAIGGLDTGSSASGDFTASPLLSSGSWASGSSSGAFTYSYQVQTPETAGGLMPKVGLSYSSQSVDGHTSSTNNQASWIGDGWDYNAGSITRTYANCRQDSKKAGSNNSTHRTADLCWGSQNATLSLGGLTTELVWDATKGPLGADGKPTGKWFTANGDGSTVQLVKGENTGNGAKDGEYWVVTTKDGTKYHFGKNKLPGWSDHGTAADDPTTRSVLTVPVYGNHANEDCYKGPTTTDWTNSYCTQGWRWGLDYVELARPHRLRPARRQRLHDGRLGPGRLQRQGALLHRRGRHLLRGQLHVQGPARLPALVRHPGRPALRVRQEVLERRSVLLDPQAPRQDHDLGPAAHRHRRPPGRRRVPAEAELRQAADRPEHGPVAGVRPAHRLRPQRLH
jgi:hypothetical protein